MESEIFSYLIVINTIVIGLLVGTAFLYSVKRFKLPFSDNEKVSEDYLRSFSIDKTWKELWLKLKKIRESEKLELSKTYKKCILQSLFVLIPSSVLIYLKTRTFFIILIVKISCLCFLIVSWRCTLNFFRTINKVVQKSLSYYHPKNEIFKGAVFSALNLVLFTSSLVLLSLISIIWVMNKHYLPQSYTRSEFISYYKLLFSFVFFTNFQNLFTSIYSIQYSTAGAMASYLVSCNKFGLEEDDPSDPAVITRQIGKIFTLITCSSSRLFCSITTVSFLGLLLFSYSPQLVEKSISMYLPILLYSLSTFVLIFCVFLLLVPVRLKRKRRISVMLKVFLIVYLLAVISLLYLLCDRVFPVLLEYVENNEIFQIPNSVVWSCLSAGCILPILIGLTLEKYSETKRKPVIEVIESCKTGEGVAIILGLSFGFKACLILFVFSSVISWSYSLAGTFGTWFLAAGSCLTLQLAYLYQFCSAFVKLTKSTCGLMHLSSLVTEKLESISEVTEKSEVLSNGLSLTSSYLVSFSSFTLFIYSSKISLLNILDAKVLCSVILGAMLPYAFASVNTFLILRKTKDLEKEVFAQCEKINKFEDFPDYGKVQEICRSGCGKNSIFFSFFLGLVFAGIKYLGDLVFAAAFVGIFLSSFLLSVYSMNSCFVWNQCKKWFSWYTDPLESSGKKESVSVCLIGEVLKKSFGETTQILAEFTSVILILSLV